MVSVQALRRMISSSSSSNHEPVYSVLCGGPFVEPIGAGLNGSLGETSYSI